MRISLEAGITNNGRELYSYIPGRDERWIVSGHGWKETQARKTLKNAVLAALQNQHDREQNWRERYIGTNEGSVFHVRADGRTYHYRIVGPRNVGISSSHGEWTFDMALEAARDHAEQCFGGVAWETR